MISLLIYILVLFLFFGVIMWVIQTLPIPHPFNMVAQGVLALILLLIVLDILLGGRFIGLPRIN